MEIPSTKWVENTFEIVNDLGMHARAAAKLVKLASRFESHIEIEKDGYRVDAKSVMGLLLLCGQKGLKLKVSARGQDAEAAVVALGNLISNGFDELIRA